MSNMYLGTEFHRYWSRCGQACVHPEDSEYLTEGEFTFDEGTSPWPFDGALEQARVVFCLANPSSGNVENKDELNKMIVKQRSGEEALPFKFDLNFEKFYKRIVGPIGLPLGVVSERVAVLNVCPYSSPSMTDQQVRLASGLPSVWQAQKYLREVLMPRALTGNIYLIMIRRHTLWGITPLEEPYGKLKVIKGHAQNAVMGPELGEEIKQWLVCKKFVDWTLPT